jgi:cobalt-zinc-cadmium efflux system outer membrane protein
MAPVAQSVEERTGHRIIWNTSSAADAEVNTAVDQLLADELTAESSVQIALLNNHSLQATFEEIGIAQADLVQAGLLKNPIFEAKIKYAEAGGGTGLELNAVGDFLDIFLIPLRKKVAAANLVAAQHRVTGEALSLAAEVKKDFYEVLAARQALEARKTVAAATEASAEFARRMHKAGNLSDLDLNQNLVANEQAKLELAKQELESAEAQERLAAVMGLWGERAAKIRVPERLGDPPADEPAISGLESRAIAHRPELLAAKSTVQGAAAAANVPSPLIWLEGAEIGATAERETAGGWVVGPIIALPIPLFDTGAAQLDRRRAEMRQATQRYLALQVQIRSQVRIASAKVASARHRAAFYRDALLPLREQVIRQTQLQYNAMQVGLQQLLSVKQEQVRTGMEYVEVIKEYWIARAELEQAVGGKLPEPATTSATRPAAPRTREPATQPTPHHMH